MSQKNDLYLIFQFKMVAANTNKACIMYYDHKQHLFNGNLKNRLRNTADQVARHSKLCLSTVILTCFHVLCI